jgi:CPA2 family monovalent cation:H+ antiporter-2
VNEFKIIEDIVIILLISIPIVFIFNRINVPSIVGFLIAGMIIGPYGFKFITDSSEIKLMAEIGIMLLLFTIGLEVSFTRLLKIKKYLLVAGGFQLLGTITIASIVIMIFGMSLKESIFLGILISLSSTAIVLKILSDKGELQAPHGRITLGILIFQDLSIVPLSLLILLLGAAENLTIPDIIFELLITFGITAIIIIVSKFLMPHIVHQIAKLRIREVFTAGIILLLLGMSLLTYKLGLSFALGAFIVGLILAESDYSHQIISEIQPFRSVFNSIFFVSIGLLLNLHFVTQNYFTIAGVALGILSIKALIIIGIVLLMKYPLRIAIIIGFGLAQIGEFSFILAEAGYDFSLISESYFNIFLAVTIFTMILTPFIFNLSPAIAAKTSIMSKPTEENGLSEEGFRDHVIIVGFGLNGSNLARVLKETGIKYIIIEMNPDTVKREKAAGEHIIYGDVAKPEILHKAWIENASIIVFAISDPSATKLALRISKNINPNIYSLVRTKYVNEIEELKRLGADIVIPEEFETSLQMFRKVLEKYHIPLNIIMQQVNLLRQESYKLLIKPEEDISSLSHIEEILARGLTETYYINEENQHIEKSLSDINLRAETGATVIAIIREDNLISTPSGKDKIMLNDTLVLTGSHQSVDKAIEKLDS